MKKIQALFCDLDETLTSDRESITFSVQHVIHLIQERFPFLEKDLILDTYLRINTWHWENFDLSPIRHVQDTVETRALIWNEVLHELNVSESDFAVFIAKEFEKARSQTYRCYPDSVPVLQSLQGRIPIILVTNGNTLMQRWKIKHCGLEPYMDAIFIGQEVGVSKPEPRMFELALDVVKVSPSHVLMVGDHPEKDITGAKHMGCLTAWMLRDGAPTYSQNPEPDFLVHNMEEVKQIIE